MHREGPEDHIGSRSHAVDEDCVDTQRRRAILRKHLLVLKLRLQRLKKAECNAQRQNPEDRKPCAGGKGQ